MKELRQLQHLHYYGSFDFAVVTKLMIITFNEPFSFTAPNPVDISIGFTSWNTFFGSKVKIND